MNANVLKADRIDVSDVKTDRFVYQWKIQNFNYLFMEPGFSEASPVFSFANGDWGIRLYPNGTKENEDFLSIRLYWTHEDILNGKVYMSLINDKQEKQAEISVKLQSVKETMVKSTKWKECNFFKFIKREKVFNMANGLLPNNCLTINCEFILFTKCVRVNKEQEKHMPIEKPHLLKKLFLDDRFSDVKLVALCGKSLPAHKGVLAACSPVFEAMFTHDMLEQKMGEVKISDGKYEVIKEMLNFIYTGDVDDLKSIVYELVKLAHKYQIAELIRLCETALNNQISADNVLKVITIADSYNIEHLKKRAIEFGSLHLKYVVNSNDFKSSMYPQAMQAVFEAFGQQ